MNPRSKTLILFLFLSVATLPLFASRTVSKEYFLNGRLKAITVTIITMPRNIDLFNFYKKTKISRTEFDSLSGRKVRETTRITQVGQGKHCYELYFRQIDYDAKGKRTRYQETRCDRKGKTVVKDYEDGKLIHIRVQKRRRLPW